MLQIRRPQHGFTIVELMVAIAVGLLMLAGLSTLFAGNNNSQMEIERANRQVENGRYAMQVLTGDLRNAGYFGEFDATNIVPATLPDPCSTSIADIRAAIPLAVQGYDNVAATTVSCLSTAGIKPGTDVVVVRHTQTCVVDAADCEPASAGGPFFQASLCNNNFELGAGTTAGAYQVGTSTGGFTLHQRNCSADGTSGTAAVLRRLLIHIYFIANNSMTGDGIPTLKRADIVSSGNTISVSIVPLAEGIENMQIEYGIENPADELAVPSVADGVADVYTPDVNTAFACSAAACRLANWSHVVSLKVNLLARTLSPSLTYTDNKSYNLGMKADGTPNVIAAANDKYKRHVFTQMVGLPNVAGRIK